MLRETQSARSFAQAFRESPLARLLVPAEATIRETLEVIDQGAKEIALVVDSAGSLLGTVTDGDIRRGMLRGLELETAVSHIMCRTPTTMPEGASPMRVLRTMLERSFTQIPLVDSLGRPVALRTLAELVRFEATPVRHAVIMAGGRGKRLMPLTENTPKPLLNVGERPIAETVVRELVQHGVRHITISVNYLAQAIREHFGDGERFGARIEYVEEDRPLGTAGALGLLSAAPEEPILVTNADLLTKVSFQSLFAFHEEEAVAATVCVRRYSFEVPYGVAELEGSRLVGMVEKPRQEFFVNAGIYVLNPEVVALVRKGEALDMPALLERARAGKLPVGAFPVREYWLDIGNPADFARAEAEYDQHFRNGGKS